MNRTERCVRRFADAGDEEAQAIVADWDRAPVVKTPIASVAHVDARRAGEASDARADRKAIRAEVARRAGGCCEACGARRGAALHWDHFWGRAREESVEGTWMLCPLCDTEKTENRPSRVWWLRRFRRHVLDRAYSAQALKVDRALALERAQHPEAT
jgi:hypothetical protein